MEKDKMLFPIILLAPVGGYVFFYNRFTKLNNHAREAWSGIEVQLKRRQDVIPQLVNIVKGYSQHEEKVFADVIDRRNRARQSTTIKERQNTENYLSQGLKSLFALAESYPELKSDTQYLKLQENLFEVEDDIQKARRYYNATVRDFNNALNTIPSSWVGKSMNYRDKVFFEISESERKNVEIDFSDSAKNNSQPSNDETESKE